MTETSRFWNSTAVGDATVAPYDASTEFSQVLMALSGSGRLINKGGVLRDELTGFNISFSGANTVTVTSGRALVYGTWYENDSTTDVTVPTPAVSTRIDTIVIRKDWTLQTARIARHAGVEGGSAPTLTQSVGSTWEIPLYDVAITIGGAITFPKDRREFLDNAQSDVQTNLLVNPGFEVWQRGAGAFTTPAGYTADRWVNSQQGTSVLSISRSSTADTGSLYSLAATYTQGNSASEIYQKLEDYGQLRGRVLTFSMRIRTSTANAIRICLWDDITTYTNSSYHTGSNAWELLSVTAVVPIGISSVQVIIRLEASCTAYLDNATLTIGTVALPYMPMHPADDLARCERYYQIARCTARAPATGAGAVFETPIAYHVYMGGTPSATIVVGSRNNLNGAYPQVSGLAQHGARWVIMSAGAGDTYALDENVDLEYNP